MLKASLIALLLGSTLLTGTASAMGRVAGPESDAWLTYCHDFAELNLAIANAVGREESNAQASYEFAHDTCEFNGPVEAEYEARSTESGEVVELAGRFFAVGSDL